MARSLRGARLVVDLDQPRRGGRLLGGLGHDHGDVLAVVQDAVVLLRRCGCRQRGASGPRSSFGVLRWVMMGP